MVPARSGRPRPLSPVAVVSTVGWFAVVCGDQPGGGVIEQHHVDHAHVGRGFPLRGPRYVAGSRASTCQVGVYPCSRRSSPAAAGDMSKMAEQCGRRREPRPVRAGRAAGDALLLGDGPRDCQVRVYRIVMRMSTPSRRPVESSGLVASRPNSVAT